MPGKIKLVVFDWNGVILADAAASWDADNHVLTAFGGKPVSQKVWRETIIIPSIQFYAKHGANRKEMEENPEKWARVFHSFYEKRVAKIRTRQGIRKVLAWLKSKGISCIILSNHTDSGIAAQLERLGLEGSFDAVLSNRAKSATLNKKTKLARLMRFIKSMKINPAQVALIGDSPEEIQMAKAVGAKSIAITGGYYATRRLEQAQPDFIIHRLEGLPACIRALEEKK